MPRSDLLINLVKSGKSGDRTSFQKTVETIIAEERAKQHNILAERLERILNSANGNGRHDPNRSILEAGSSKARNFIAEITPRRELEELFLPETTRMAVNQLVEEQRRASILRSHSLEPKHSILLVGPPGNGKTSLAEAIAESLAVPFLVVRYETMIGSFLGETAGRLKHVFDYARTIPCVLFFDEFDAVGKERGDNHETGEIKRVVTSLLMQIDELPSYVVVIAATNHSELLDRAVWRRFDLRLSLPPPNQNQIATFLKTLAERTDVELGVSAQRAARKLKKASYGEAERFFLDLARRQVLALGERPADEIAKEQLEIWTTRVCDSEQERRISHRGTPATKTS